MFATYNASKPGKTLNIREAPGGAVIGTLADGHTVPVEVIERGWCKLDDGYADARFLTITAEPPAGYEPADEDDNATAETGGFETNETGGSDDNTANDGNTAPEGSKDDPQTAEPPADEAAELYKMTNPHLYDLAKNSGINVKAGMNKNALVEAILAGAND